ncbi:hypothetical protein Misp01_68710 [Microtetraspora sp. NBRC 13810]|uniref:helix-turn-helix transcriptional regulator n=1 Tax=Microtetraspora sp. NBRC 13810 TaxID=3030990 RepID=UPI0024A39252|nr:helix-turn-helix transcriptional regulator [Microtetraspora sp. NBRC 13810]GLW11743.1 hypothetical protein Misp01_68710 [Microtetraspora sp. NBRC 13810]
MHAIGRTGETAGGAARFPGPGLGPWALALLDLGHGRPALALRRFGEGPLSTMAAIRSTPDLVEAAVHAGRRAEIGDRVTRFEHWAAVTGRPGPIALALRIRALLSEGIVACAHYRRALQVQEIAAQPFELARTRLLYGEWLRRKGRRARALRLLASALTGFEEVGAAPWAGRALAELRAGGGLPAPGEQDAPATRPTGPRGLTPQELRVVRLAAEGATNRDIAAQLALSRRTVGNHLYKAFAKLGVTSRAELHRLALSPAEGSPGVPSPPAVATPVQPHRA